MGNCGGISEIDQFYNPNPIQANKSSNKKARNSKPTTPFKDFEEYKNGKTIGNGIQQIPSYKCLIAYDELNQLREEFWKSKRSNIRIWNCIRECCSTDSETAVILLEAAELACLKGDLRQVFSLSNPDVVFTVPNFCVCDPSFEKDYNSVETKAKDIKEEPLELTLYHLAANKNMSISITNKTSGKAVKVLFAKKAKIDRNHNVIRLLFKGQELLDDHLLCYHNVENGSKIQVMVRPKDI